MVYVYYCKNTPVTDNIYGSWLALMPSGFVAKINKLERREDAQASVMGRLMLLYALKQLDHGDLSLCNIRRSSFQRPYFDGTDIDFNISHSGEYVVFAIGWKNRVGIDIEQIKPIILDNFGELFSPAELREIRSHPEGELEGFYNLWTQKEALVKAEGTGLTFPVKEVCITKGRAVLSGHTWRLQELHVSDGYKAHLAFQVFSDEEISVKIQLLYIGDLCPVCSNIQ